MMSSKKFDTLVRGLMKMIRAKFNYPKTIPKQNVKTKHFGRTEKRKIPTNQLHFILKHTKEDIIMLCLVPLEASFRKFIPYSVR